MSPSTTIKCDTQRNSNKCKNQNIIGLSIVYSECLIIAHYAVEHIGYCFYAECYYAECRYTESYCTSEKTSM